MRGRSPWWSSAPGTLFFQSNGPFVNKTENLVIFFHGVGASGAQLMPLASSWRMALPHTRFAAPDAPYHRTGGPEWFSVDSDQLDPARIKAVRQAFDDTVSAVLAREDFTEALNRVAFVGVSQGAIVAMDAVATGRWQIGALVSFAGLLPPTPVSAKAARTHSRKG